MLFFGIAWGMVICVLLFSGIRKAEKSLRLVTILGLVIVVILAIDFTGHMLHLTYPLILCQKPMVNAIHGTFWIIAIPLSLIKLYELWSKKRTRRLTPPQI